MMKRLASSIAAVALAIAAGASGAAANYPQIENGSEFTISNADTVLEFVAPETGVLTIETNAFEQYAGLAYNTLLYLSPEHDLSDAYMTFSRSLTSEGWTYYYTVTGGVAYYLWLDGGALYEPATLKFSFEPGLPRPRINYVAPEPSADRIYNFATYPELQVMFNMVGDVRFESSELLYQTANGQKSIHLDFVEVYDGTSLRYDFNVYGAVTSVRDEMLTDTEFSVVITKPEIDGDAVTGEYVDADGNVTLTYLYQKQTTVKSLEYPDPFLSYWPEDSEGGIIKIEFDGNLLPPEEQENLSFGIFAGDYKDGENGWPQLPGAPIVLGEKTVTIDLRGVIRETDQSTVTILIQGLLAANGFSIDYRGSGVVDIYNIPYVLLKNVSLEYEFTPAAGSLADVDEVELWTVSDTFRHVSFEGFRYVLEGDAQPVEISMEEVEIKPDIFNPDDSLMYIPVPEKVRRASGDVTLSAVLSSLDGYEYDIEVTYSNGDNAVEAIGAESGADTRIYNLQGIEVKGTPAPGLYIVGGRKVKL